MTDHEIEIHRYVPKGKNNQHYIAICSCGRWRSDPYRERDNAENKGEMHMVLGDDDLRKQAAFDRGTSTLRAQYKWYTEMAEDPFTPEAHREMWQRLADELRPRVVGADADTDDPLF